MLQFFEGSTWNPAAATFLRWNIAFNENFIYLHGMINICVKCVTCIEGKNYIYKYVLKIVWKVTYEWGGVGDWQHIADDCCKYCYCQHDCHFCKYCYCYSYCKYCYQILLLPAWLSLLREEMSITIYLWEPSIINSLSSTYFLALFTIFFFYLFLIFYQSY